MPHEVIQVWMTQLLTNCSKNKLTKLTKLGEPELKQIEILIHPTVLFFVYYLGVTMQPEITMC